MNSYGQQASSAQEALARDVRELKREEEFEAKLAFWAGVVLAALTFMFLLGAIVALLIGNRYGWVFGLGLTAFLCLAGSIPLLAIGFTNLGKLRRETRLRQSGVAGMATVLSFAASSYRVDGDTPHTLTVRVDLPGRQPWVTNIQTMVPRARSIGNGSTLRVCVDTTNGEMLVDWWQV